MKASSLILIKLRFSFIWLLKNSKMSVLHNRVQFYLVNVLLRDASFVDLTEGVLTKQTEDMFH